MTFKLNLFVYNLLFNVIPPYWDLPINVGADTENSLLKISDSPGGRIKNWWKSRGYAEKSRKKTNIWRDWYWFLNQIKSICIQFTMLCDVFPHWDFLMCGADFTFEKDIEPYMFTYWKA